MGKKRVFEMAKEMGYSNNQDLIERLRRNGFEVKSHSSSVEEEDVKRAFEKEEDRRRASTEEKRVSGKVIRRRAKGGGDSAVVRRRPKAEPAEDSAVEAKAIAPDAPASPAAPAETPAAETPAAEPPAEAPAVEAKSEAKPAEAKAEAKPAEAKAKPAAAKAEAKPAEAKTEAEARAKPAEAKTEAKAEAKPTEAKAKAKPAEAKPAAKPAQAEPAEAEKAPAEAERSVVESTPAPTEVKAEAKTEAAAPPADEAPAAPEKAAEAPATEAPAAEAPAVEAKTEAAPAAEEAPAAEAGEADVSEPQAPAQAAEGAEDKGGDDDTSDRREVRAARPERRSREDDYDDDEKPDLDLEDFGLSEADFAMRPQEETGTRVAPPPPSTTVPNPKKDVAQPRVVRKIDPEVLKKRLESSKRPEPPKEWGVQKAEPAPGVTEKVMVRDAGGKGKLVDARDVAKNKKTGGRPKREDLSAKELLEAKTRQVFYPTPSRKKPKGKKKAQVHREPVNTVAKQPVQIGDTITVAELSQQMSRKANELIMWLMRNGVMANINQPIDHDTAAMLASEMGYEVTSLVLDESDLLSGESLEEVKEKAVKTGEPRAPVVTVMGHVDHGKTSLLDKIRDAKVAEGEAGGITQRIAGYQVETAKGTVTFLDTPGHAAFTSMRARGANVTDIVVLVVAADDGVMPQTREAIRHAKAAKVPMIVAINKMDKPEANPGRVLQQLTEHQVVVEEYGGDVLAQKISAKTGEGIDALLEQLALQAEVLELKAERDVPAVGSVVEGHIHKGRGPVATILVQEGTLRKGDIVVVGESVGKVRAMMVDGGRPVKEAGPSTPVEILGLDAVPNPGEEVRVAKDMPSAKELAAHRREKRRAQELSGTAKVSLQDLFGRMSGDEQKELKLILKGDLQGSVEALGKALTDLTTQKVKVSVVSSGVGAVNESDVEFAAASEAIVVGFAVRPDTKALKSARALGVDIRTYDIIYEAVDEVQAAMRGLLAPVAKEQYLGRAEVLQTFTVPKVGTVAGCKIVDGVMQRNANIRLLRDSKVIYDGKLASLKRFKDDVREVKEGFECGMGMERFNDIKVGDIFEAYEIVMTEAALDEATGAGGRAKAEARP